MDTFNYSHSPRMLEMPMECIDVDLRVCDGFTLILAPLWLVNRFLFPLTFEFDSQ